MHDDNIFHNAKYSSITEGAVKGLLNDMGYYFTDEGEHAGKWVHEKTGKVLSDKHAMDIAAERAARKPKAKKNTTAAGANPTDKDARKQDEESTRSEEVEYDGEELEESDRFRPIGNSPRWNRFTSRGSLTTGDAARGVENGRPGPDNSPYGRARMRSGDIKKKISILKAKDRGTDRMFDREFGSSVSTRTESLFQKDSDRLLREHIRAEYEARGIYPTAREVQETYNQVMSLLEKVSAEEKARRKSLIYGDETEEQTRMRRRGIIGGDRAPHVSRRGVQTNISPSSPARYRSRKEIETRKLGLTSTDVINQMNQLRKTNR
jgi:ribosomal protein L12E/L44/L45/RPP1/RPP2